MAANPGFSHPPFGSPPDLIYLNYARADRERVGPVAAALRARGASVWYDAGLAAGSSVYVESAQRALRRTGLMLVFVSAASAKSAWVADELRAYRSLMARESGHRLLAVHLDRTRAPLALAGVDSVDAHDDHPEVTANLIASALADQALLPAPAGSLSSSHMASSATAIPPAAPQAPATQPQMSAAANAASGQVFVSYARSDRDRVQPLIGALRAQGVTVWDDSGLAHGSRGWVETARAALEQSQTLLVAVSAASVSSPWVADDVRAFQSMKTRAPGRALVAVHLDRTRAPLSLARAHVVDAQSLAPEVAAGLIAGALPAAPAVSTMEAVAPVPDKGEVALEAPASVAMPTPAEVTPIGAPMVAVAETPEAATATVEESPAEVVEAAVAPVAMAQAVEEAPAGLVEVASVEAVEAVEAIAPASGMSDTVKAPAAHASVAETEAAAPAEPAASMAAVAVAVEEPPAPAPEAPAAPTPAAQPEMTLAGLADTAPAPAVKRATSEAVSSAPSAAPTEVKQRSRAGEAFALLVVLLIAIAIAWALSFL